MASQNGIESKDVVMWVTPEETKPDEFKIDWDCPCLDSAKKGSCGTLFIDALQCAAENKLELCGPKFLLLHECMGKFPEEYKEFL